MHHLKHAIAIAAAGSVLSACVGVNTVTLHRAAVEGAEASAPSSDGVAFLSGMTCIHIADRGAEIRTSTFRDFSSPTEFVRIAIWVIPNRADAAVAVALNEVRLSYDDGTTVAPSHFQVSSFKTRWEREKTILFPSNEVEKFANVSHEARKELVATTEIDHLWDLTRITVEFPRGSGVASPETLKLLGVKRNGVQLLLPLIRFTKITESRAVYPGTSADGVFLTDTPWRACRRLQQNAARPN